MSYAVFPQTVSRLSASHMPALLPAWIAATTMLAITLFVPAIVLRDGDSFWHVTVGDWIIAHGAVPHADPFSYTFAGAPWAAHEWLSEVLMAAAFRLAGWSGVIVLTALAVALALFQLARHIGHWLPAGPSLLLLLLAGCCVIPLLLARPHVLALPVLETWVAGLFIARSDEHAPPWRLLPIMCLWANLHGGFMLGLFLVVPLTLEAALAEPAAWRSVLARWGSFLLAAATAATLTPHGLTGLLFPFQLVGMAALEHISEWQPPAFAVIQPLELVLVAGLYVALTRGARLPPVRLMLLLGLLHMSLHHTRHQMLVGMIVPLLIAEPLGAALTREPEAPADGRLRAGGLAAMAGLVAVRLLLPVAWVDRSSAPVSALAHVPSALAAEPVFNAYNFGGYLIYSHIRPFIDGRAELYGDAFIQRYVTASAPNKTALETTLRDYKVRWTILEPDSPVVALMDALPRWCRLYADKVAVVHTTECGSADAASSGQGWKT